MNFNTKFVIAKSHEKTLQSMQQKDFNTKFVIAKFEVCKILQPDYKFQYKICYSKILRFNGLKAFPYEFQYKICYSKINLGK